MNNKKVKIIYILGSGRSGSTLLDRIISTSSNAFSVGELSFLKSYINRYDELIPTRAKEKFVDLSGEYLSDSFFWSPIIKKIKKENLKVYYKKEKVCFAKKRKFDDFTIYSEILKRARQVEGEQVEYIVDSSKNLRRLFFLLKQKDLDIYVIHLVRDFRGVLNSLRKNNPKASILVNFFSWFRANLLMSVFLLFFVKNKKRHLIGYESFCLDTTKYLKKINDRIGLKIDLERYIEKANNPENHIFAGNKMRREALKEIKIDVHWKKKFSLTQRVVLTVICYLPNKIWVYRN